MPTVSTTSVSPSQRPMRMPVNRQIGILGVLPSVGIDAPHSVAVAFAEHRDAPRGYEDLHRVVRDQHPTRHAVRQAVIENQLRSPGAILGEQEVDLRFGRRRPRRLLAAFPAPLVRDVGHPDAAEVRQLGERAPVGRARLRVGRRCGDGGDDRSQKASREGWQTSSRSHGFAPNLTRRPCCAQRARALRSMSAGKSATVARAVSSSHSRSAAMPRSPCRSG